MRKRGMFQYLSSKFPVTYITYQYPIKEAVK